MVAKCIMIIIIIIIITKYNSYRNIWYDITITNQEYLNNAN